MPIAVTRATLVDLGVSPSRADRYAPDLATLLPAHAIDTPLRQAHFLAQVLHESGAFRTVEENLRYSAARLLAVFPRYFTPARAAEYAGRPQSIGSRVYANRLGNGDEASGDGYRYRGRGLIQLTGRANYRRFAAWVGDDVVASPDLVCDAYALHCAVFYWSENRVNAAADADDVRAVTRRINGGLIGLADRMRLLDRAKAALLPGGTTDLDGATHVVRATQLNLRSAPRVAPDTRLATLADGAPVAALGEADAAGWLRVRVLLGGQLVEGFVKAEFLRPLARSVPRRDRPIPPPVDLPAGRRDVTRRRATGRAHPLGEPRMPRRSAATAARRAEQLVAIVRWLDVENRRHRRYGPAGVYAYDFCRLAGVYLPRVFWTAAAQQRLRAGESPPVRYGDTVRELNANALHWWLEDFGAGFGWRRAFDLDVLQAAANLGEVCLITAQHGDLDRPGRVAAVVPEHGRWQAPRDRRGEVRRPMQSHAGASRRRTTVAGGTWWRAARYRSFGFWRHP